eukprot:6181178-Pleurochrysis_carterae.AAC.2
MDQVLSAAHIQCEYAIDHCTCTMKSLSLARKLMLANTRNDDKISKVKGTHEAKAGFPHEQNN